MEEKKKLFLSVECLLINAEGMFTPHYWHDNASMGGKEEKTRERKKDGERKVGKKGKREMRRREKKGQEEKMGKVRKESEADTYFFFF